MEQEPEIGLSSQTREGVINLLRQILADENVLAVKTRNFHWNLIGEDFSSLHKLFGKQYDMIDGFIDDLAERIRKLGEPSPGSIEEFSRISQLAEKSGVLIAKAEAMSSLLADHEFMCRSLRAAIEATEEIFDDDGTMNMLTGMLEDHEKAAWFLRASLA